MTTVVSVLVRFIVFEGAVAVACRAGDCARRPSGPRLPENGMADVPQTDVSRPSALPTAKLLHRGPAQPLVEQNSAEYLDSIEEEWNKKVDMEIETLVDGMVDFVSLASVSECVGHMGRFRSSDFLSIRSGTRINFGLPRKPSRPSLGQSRW